MFFQVEFKGLSGVGEKLDQFLKRVFMVIKTLTVG